MDDLGFIDAKNHIVVCEFLYSALEALAQKRHCLSLNPLDC